LTLTSEIIVGASQRLVFLVGVEEGAVGFEIRSLQEFMAAQALHSGTESQIQDRLSSLAGITSWRNVFMFAASRCFASDQHLRDSIIRICLELADEVASDRLSWRIGAGHVLALELLEEGSCRYQPKYVRLLYGQARQLLGHPLAEYQRRLARVCADLSIQELLDELKEALHGPHAEVRTGAWRALIFLGEAGMWGADEVIKLEFKNGSITAGEFLAQLVEPGTSGLLRQYLTSMLPLVDPDLDLQTPVARQLDLSEGEPKYPAWVQAAYRVVVTGYADFHSAPRVAMTLAEGRESVELVPLFPLSSRDGEHLVEIPEPRHPNWRKYILAAKFLKEPSSETLRIAAHEWLTAGGAEYRVKSLPWPLALVVLSARRSGGSTPPMDAVIVSSDSDQWDCGTPEEWLSVESGWLENGVSIKRIDHIDLSRCREQLLRGSFPDCLLWSLNYNAAGMNPRLLNDLEHLALGQELSVQSSRIASQMALRLSAMAIIGSRHRESTVEDLKRPALLIERAIDGNTARRVLLSTRDLSRAIEAQTPSGLQQFLRRIAGAVALYGGVAFGDTEASTTFSTVLQTIDMKSELDGRVCLLWELATAMSERRGTAVHLPAMDPRRDMPIRQCLVWLEILVGSAPVEDLLAESDAIAREQEGANFLRYSAHVLTDPGCRSVSEREALLEGMWPYAGKPQASGLSESLARVGLELFAGRLSLFAESEVVAGLSAEPDSGGPA